MTLLVGLGGSKRNRKFEKVFNWHDACRIFCFDGGMRTSLFISLTALGKALSHNGTPDLVMVRVADVCKVRFFHDPTRPAELGLTVVEDGEWSRPCVLRVVGEEVQLLEEPIVSKTVVIYTLRAPPAMLAGCSSLKTE